MEEAEDKRRGECWIDIGMIIHTLLKKPSPARFHDDWTSTYRFLKCPKPLGAARLTKARQVGRS